MVLKLTSFKYFSLRSDKRQRRKSALELIPAGIYIGYLLQASKIIFVNGIEFTSETKDLGDETRHRFFQTATKPKKLFLVILNWNILRFNGSHWHRVFEWHFVRFFTWVNFNNRVTRKIYSVEIIQRLEEKLISKFVYAIIYDKNSYF